MIRKILVARIQCLKFFAQHIRMLCQIIWLDIVFAGQGADRKEALLTIFQIAGVKIEPFEEPLHPVLSIAQLDHGAAQGRQWCIKRFARIA